MKGNTGTRKWGKVNKRIFNGCENDCRYCYARYDAVVRFYKRTGKTEENWKDMKLNLKAFGEKPYKIKDGRIFAFSTHDIVKKYINETVKYLKGWLEVGNEILIVTKPSFECIEILCRELAPYKSQIVFRFTIGSRHDINLKFWDRNAPLFDERFKSLCHAYYNGFETSVSCEPFFDKGIVDLVNLLSKYVTDTIWVGTMNMIKPRVNTKGWGANDLEYLREVKECQTPEYIRIIYERLRGNKKVRWKESIEKMLCLEEGDVG